MSNVNFIGAVTFEKKNLYRRTCTLDNVFFRGNWQHAALFKADKGLVIVFNFLILRNNANLC